MKVILCKSNHAVVRQYYEPKYVTIYIFRIIKSAPKVSLPDSEKTVATPCSHIDAFKFQTCFKFSAITS